VLGQTARQRLFPDQANPIGELARVDGIPLRIVGVLAARGSSLTGADEDDQIFLPLSTLHERLLGGKHHVTMLLAAPRSEAVADRAVEAVTRALRHNRGLAPEAPDDFQVSSVREMAEVATLMSNTLRVVLLICTSVCLLLGGISITYVMLVAVADHAREIRLRRAGGGSRWGILLGYLGRATRLGLAGGVIGLVLGVGISLAMARIVYWPLVLDPGAALLGLAAAAGIGALFGLYPAIKASRLGPVEALPGK
jgi:putative ABC transport system permease protein